MLEMQKIKSKVARQAKPCRLLMVCIMISSSRRTTLLDAAPARVSNRNHKPRPDIGEPPLVLPPRHPSAFLLLNQHPPSLADDFTHKARSKTDKFLMILRPQSTVSNQLGEGDGRRATLQKNSRHSAFFPEGPNRGNRSGLRQLRFQLPPPTMKSADRHCT
jgi:hypothetical protein